MANYRANRRITALVRRIARRSWILGRTFSNPSLTRSKPNRSSSAYKQAIFRVRITFGYSPRYLPDTSLQIRYSSSMMTENVLIIKDNHSAASACLRRLSEKRLQWRRRQFLQHKFSSEADLHPETLLFHGSSGPTLPTWRIPWQERDRSEDVRLANHLRLRV